MPMAFKICSPFGYVRYWRKLSRDLCGDGIRFSGAITHPSYPALTLEWPAFLNFFGVYSRVYIYNRLALIMCLLLDMDLALYGLFLLYEVKFIKSWRHFNVMEIRFYSNQRKHETDALEGTAIQDWWENGEYLMKWITFIMQEI